MVSDGKIPPRTDPASIPEPDQHAFADVGKNLGDAWAAMQTYISAQAARFRVAVRNFFLLAVLAIFAVGIALSIIIASAVLLMVGFADALTAVLGGRQWAGDLIVGGVVVGGTALSGYIIIKRMSSVFRKHTISSYEQKKSQN